MVMNFVGLVGWVAAWFGLIGVLVVFLSPGFIPLVVPFMMVAFYRAFVQLAYFPAAARMHRVLLNYPWQHLSAVPRGLGKHPDAQDDGMWFEISNPADPGRMIPLVFLKSTRSFWWIKRIGGPRTNPELKAQIEPLWFAGDPRYIAVVAASGRENKAPRRLHFLYQRAAFDRRIPPASWGASPDDLERARRAGAQVPEHAPSPPRPY
ncbi:hypothetical protein ABT112_10415 [Streptomyces sp. NPDC002055]|uniref:hypothetical protein n=1 Tax=Streptomyces sp. NPDC002055 TaxID=3154534 RepID=UPI00332051D8